MQIYFNFNTQDAKNHRQTKAHAIRLKENYIK